MLVYNFNVCLAMMQPTEEEQYAEQHRLIYVAMTRAKERLTLSCIRFSNDPAGNAYLQEALGARDAQGHLRWNAILARPATKPWGEATPS